MSRNRKEPDLQAEVDRIRARVDSAVGTQRFMATVQLDELARAEKLRKLVATLVNSRLPMSRGGAPGTAVVGRNAMNAIEKFVFDTGLKPFAGPAHKLRKLRAQLRTLR